MLSYTMASFPAVMTRWCRVNEIAPNFRGKLGMPLTVAMELPESDRAEHRKHRSAA
jgi:hypothetical protein